MVGWVVAFKLTLKKQYNEVIFHVRLNDNDAKIQQETIGVMGTNLIYGCFNLL